MFKQIGKSYLRAAALFTFLFLSLLCLGQTDVFAETCTVINANISVNDYYGGTDDLAGATRKKDTMYIVAYEYSPPTVSQVSPSGGPVCGGNTVNILGSNLDNATSVQFGSNAAAFSIQSPVQILATVPAGSLGTVNVTVTTPGGTSDATIYNTYAYLPPIISSAYYSANTGTLTVTGANFGVGASIAVNKLTLTGEGDSPYTLTTANVNTSSNTNFSVMLNALDKAAVNQILNKDGTSSTGGTTFNLSAADDWDSAATGGDTTDAVNAVTVSNVAVPALSSATYNASAGTLTVTGTGFLIYAGLSNDIDVSKLAFAGEGGTTYTLTDSLDVDITSGTSFTVVLSTTDKVALNMIVNKIGSISTGGTTYGLEAAEDWAAGADAAVVVADTAGNPVTVGNVAVPAISFASYDKAAGILTVTGTGFVHLSGADNDIDVTRLTITGEGGATYTLTNSTGVEITSGTLFDVTLNATDKAAVDLIINKNGTNSIGGTLYNLAAAEDWARGADAAVAVHDLIGNVITASNINALPVTSNLNGDTATYIEDGPAVLLDTGSDATVTDTDSADFDGGTVTVAITANRVSTEDVLSVSNVGTGAGQIGVNGSNITYGIATIGTFSGGTGTADLVISLNSNATPASVQALIRSLAYSNTNTGDPSLAARTVSVTINDGDGGTSIAALVTVNVTPVNDSPEITITNPNNDLIYNSTQTITVSGTVTDAEEQTVTVSATINGKTRSTSIDTGTGSSWTLTWSISSLSVADGRYTGIAFEVDDGTGGTASAIYSGNITVDTQAPDTTITTCPSNPSNTSSAIFTFSSEAGAGFEAKLDGFAFINCTSNVTVSGLSDGSHTLQVRAIDKAGNVDPTPASYTWSVDTLVPDTTIAAYPSNPWGSTSASFTFNSSDMSATFEASLDGAAFSPATNPVSFTGLAEGSHTFQVRAVDAAGNRDSTPASYTWTVDCTGPSVSISAPSAAVTAGGSITYTVTYAEANSVSLSAGDITLNETGTASGSVSVSGTGVTTRTVTISSISGDGTLGINIAAETASDSIGNTAPAAGPSSPFTVDNTAPTGTLSINNGAAFTTDLQVTLNITGSDGAGSGVRQMRFSLDAASWSPWQNISNTKTGILSASYGTVTVYMQLRDNAGNVSGNIADTIIYKAPPVSSGITKYGPEDREIALSVADFVYSSCDGSALEEIKIESLPSYAVLMLDNTEMSVAQSVYSADLDRIVFVPAANWSGSDSFTWTGYDGTLWTDTAMISFVVSPVNDAPVAANTSINVDADTPGSGTLAATDTEGDALTFEVVTQGTKGTLVITDSENGSFLYTPDIGESGNDNVTFRVYDQQDYSNTGSVTIRIIPASDADLTALSISSGTLSPAFSASTADYQATVENSVSFISVTASARNRHATIKINGVSALSGSPSAEIELSVGSNSITVEVIAQDGTKKTYRLDVTRIEGSTNNDGRSNSRDKNKNTPTGTGVNIQVNGKDEMAGTLTTHTDVSGQTIAAIVVDQQKLEKKLAEAGSNCVVNIFVPNTPDIAVAELNGQVLSSLESGQSTLQIKTDSAAYALPAAQINVDAISAQLGSPVQLSEIKVSIRISRAPYETTKVLENLAKAGKFSIVAPPVDFTVECTYGGKSVFISSFNVYVERMLAVPDGVGSAGSMTGIVIDPDGTVRHVPTKIVSINGNYFARISSLTNSSYAVIRHPLQFGDAENHWSRDAVNDMGSRMIITGVGEGVFEPDRDITRAEFAAIMVRALGLKPGTGSNPFTDVENGMWYTDYIKTAYQYNIISGYSNNTFRPTDKITREQAMAMVSRTMKLTGMKAQLGGEVGAQNILSAFTDISQASEWAKEGIAVCVRTGIISGRSNGLAAPKANITRAEVAAMIKRLLQKSNLI